MFSLLPKDQREVLLYIKTGNAREVTRAHALNMRHKGCAVIEAADFLELTPRTVINICSTYRDHGVKRAVRDEPRSGRPIKFDDRAKCKIIATVCSEPPEGFDHWTLDLIKERVEKDGIVETIGRDTVRVILKEHDLKPWQQEMWCVPELDEEFIERMEDVLDVYEMPYDSKKPVVCLDEKPIVLHGEKKSSLPMEEGKPKRVDYEYVRNGSANTFCAVEPKTGVYLNRVTTTRNGVEFAKFMDVVDRKFPEAEKIVLVMDNLSTHKEKFLINYYGEKEGKKLWNRFEVHYTPKHGSWLNQAEIAIGMYQRQCLGDTRIPDIQMLRKKTNAWNNIINRKKVTIKWKFTTLDAREKFHYE